MGDASGELPVQIQNFIQKAGGAGMIHDSPGGSDVFVDPAFRIEDTVVEAASAQPVPGEVPDPVVQERCHGFFIRQYPAFHGKGGFSVASAFLMFFRRVGRRGFPVQENHAVCLVFQTETEGVLTTEGKDPVIAVDKKDPVPSGFGESAVSGGGYPCVFLVDHPDSGIGFSQLITKSGAGFSGAPGGA